MDQTPIQIDCGQSAGPVRALHGVNLGPLSFNGSVNLSSWFQQIQFPTVRLHDCIYYYPGAVDIPCIFPFFHLDDADPRHYQFDRTDKYVRSVLDCHSRIVYRLGISIINVHAREGLHEDDPPADPLKWARVAVNIIKHYNQGWANGYHYGIPYWEIWNEPDDGPGMWNGTWQQYVDFYITVAKYIKSQCPDIKIGGPSFNGGMIDSQDIMHRFLPQVKENHCPLDFLSWHVYPERPSQQTNAARNVRRILDDYGFTLTESHLNEWNMAPYRNVWCDNLLSPQSLKTYTRQKKSPQNAALAAACLIAMQDAPIDMANFYDASTSLWGLFQECGYPAKPFFAFKAFKTLLDAAPNRLAVTGSDPDNALAVLAAVSEDKKTIQILLSNTQHPAPQPWRITLNRLPFSPARICFYALDEFRDLQLEQQQTAAGPSVTLDCRVMPHCVYLLTIGAE